MFVNLVSMVRTVPVFGLCHGPLLGLRSSGPLGRLAAMFEYRPDHQMAYICCSFIRGFRSVPVPRIKTETVLQGFV